MIINEEFLSKFPKHVKEEIFNFHNFLIRENLDMVISCGIKSISIYDAKGWAQDEDLRSYLFLTEINSIRKFESLFEKEYSWSYFDAKRNENEVCGSLYDALKMFLDKNKYKGILQSKILQYLVDKNNGKIDEETFDEQ